MTVPEVEESYREGFARIETEYAWVARAFTGGFRTSRLAVPGRDHIELALRRTNGHRGQAATMLGISERNLYRKLRDYGLEP